MTLNDLIWDTVWMDNSLVRDRNGRRTQILDAAAAQHTALENLLLNHPAEAKDRRMASTTDPTTTVLGQIPTGKWLPRILHWTSTVKG